jgi:hypothetical protein
MLMAMCSFFCLNWLCFIDALTLLSFFKSVFYCFYYFGSLISLFRVKMCWSVFCLPFRCKALFWLPRLLS